MKVVFLVLLALAILWVLLEIFAYQILWALMWLEEYLRRRTERRNR